MTIRVNEDHCGQDDVNETVLIDKAPKVSVFPLHKFKRFLAFAFRRHKLLHFTI